MAKKYHLPLFLHSRAAHIDFVGILREEGFGEDVLGMNGLPDLTDSEAEEENRVNALLVRSPSAAVAQNGDFDYGSQPTPPRLNDHDNDTITHLGVESNLAPVRQPNVGPVRQHIRGSSPVSIFVSSIVQQSLICV